MEGSGMIDVSIFQGPDGGYTGFRVKGHAGYADHGRDIVCAAVSALVINTINSVAQFTEDVFENTVDPDRGIVFFSLTKRPVSVSSELLLKSLVLGLSGIEDEYGKKHIRLHIINEREV